MPPKLFNHNLSSEFDLNRPNSSPLKRFGKKKDRNPEKKTSERASSSTFWKGSSARQVKTDDLSQYDIIIAVMGPTGSGKSTFINTITGYETCVGHSLESCTSKVSAVRLSIPELADGDLVFVDTPGFDDTHKSDVLILKMVAEWLKSTYEKDILLSGLLYFHRISDNRMAGTPLKNLRMFEELCGKNAFQNVILTTTMWDEIDEETGEAREEELKKKYWRSMLERNSTTSRFLRTRESALALIDPLIDKANTRATLLLQKEMVDMCKKLPVTSAGQELFSTMEELVRKREDLLRRIRTEMKRAEGDTMALEPLQEEHEKLQINLESTVKEMQKLKLPLSSRLNIFTHTILNFVWPKFPFRLDTMDSKMSVALAMAKRQLTPDFRHQRNDRSGLTGAKASQLQRAQAIEISLPHPMHSLDSLPPSSPTDSNLDKELFLTPQFESCNLSGLTAPEEDRSQADSLLNTSTVYADNHSNSTEQFTPVYSSFPQMAPNVWMPHNTSGVDTHIPSNSLTESMDRLESTGPEESRSQGYQATNNQFNGAQSTPNLYSISHSQTAHYDTQAVNSSSPQLGSWPFGSTSTMPTTITTINTNTSPFNPTPHSPALNSYPNSRAVDRHLSPEYQSDHWPISRPSSPTRVSLQTPSIRPMDNTSSHGSFSQRNW